MGWLRNPGQAAKDKAKQVANDATRATCYRCGHSDLKAYFKKFNSKDWICRNAGKCDKRREKQGDGGMKHSRRQKFENGWWVD